MNELQCDACDENRTSNQIIMINHTQDGRWYYVVRVARNIELISLLKTFKKKSSPALPHFNNPEGFINNIIYDNSFFNSYVSIKQHNIQVQWMKNVI